MSASGTITAGAVQELLSALVKWRPESAGINARAEFRVRLWTIRRKWFRLPPSRPCSRQLRTNPATARLAWNWQGVQDFGTGPISHLMQTAQPWAMP